MIATRPNANRQGAAGLPRAVKYVLKNAALGASIGVLFGSATIATNVAGLRGLILESSDPVTPVILILAGFATLFGGIYTATTIMRMPAEDEES